MQTLQGLSHAEERIAEVMYEVGDMQHALQQAWRVAYLPRTYT